MGIENSLVLDLGKGFGRAVTRSNSTIAARVLAVAAQGAARAVGRRVPAGNRAEIAQLLHAAAEAWELI